jgi:hypothetical protein
MKTYIVLIGVIVGSMLAVAQTSHNQSTPPLSIAISVPASVTVGTDVEVRIRTTNTADHDINVSSFYSDGVDFAFEYDIRDESGKPIEIRKKPRGGSIVPLTLSPGETKEGGTFISHIGSMKLPGQYTIQLFRTVPGDGIVYSNKVTVTVTPSEPPNSDEKR